MNRQSREDTPRHAAGVSVLEESGFHGMVVRLEPAAGETTVIELEWAP